MGTNFWAAIPIESSYSSESTRQGLTMTLLSILVFGFFFGMRHATDADHVIAVSTIVSRQNNIRHAAMTGIFWGIGHSITLLVVGGAIILFGIVIPERLGLSLEFCVALMLILLGAFNLRVAVRTLPNANAGNRDVEPHRHWEPGRGRALRSAMVGITHGLAGSAAVALLVLPLVPDPFWGMMYLAVYSVGTIIGMMIITATIAVPVSYAGRFGFFHRHLGTVAGLISLSFGLSLVYQIGFVEGLFQ